MPRGELDEDLAAVVEGAQRPPRGTVAGHVVAEVDVGQVDAGRDRLDGLGLGVLAAQRDELVLRILPGHRRHVGLLGRAQFHVIGPRIGVDDEIGHQFGARRLDQDMTCLVAPAPLSVSPMIQRTVSPAATGPEPTSCSPG